MSEPIDYTAVLADLEQKRDGLDRAIAAIREIVATGGGLSGGPPNGTPGKPAAAKEMRPDAFFNMKAPEAVRTYLGMVKRPQTVREIADALQLGGFITSAKDLYNNLYTAILRMQGDGIVVKVHGKWGLSDWYPARPKNKAKAEAGEKGVAGEGDTHDNSETAA